MEKYYCYSGCIYIKAIDKMDARVQLSSIDNFDEESLVEVSAKEFITDLEETVKGRDKRIYELEKTINSLRPHIDDNIPF